MALVLVVDDEPLSCFTIAEMVEGLGHETLQANSVKEALDLFNRNPCDLVLTDIVMPVVDGNTLIKAIRTLNKDIPVIAVSGSGRTLNHDYLEVAKQVGASEVLLKPFGLKELEQTLFDFLPK